MKFYYPSRQSIAILGLSTLITACGGGGSSGSNNTTPPPQSTTLEFTIEGVVTDAPVANAEIVFSIGDEVLTTTADADGHYTLEVSVDESRAEDMVRAEATHPQNPQIKLVSILGSVARLDLAAGVDDLLTKEENFSVNVTNVSTAIAAIMENGVEGSITSDSQLSKAQKAVNGDIALSLATAIKLVLDFNDIPQAVMPEGIADTYALVSDLRTTAEYVQKLQKLSPGTYSDALNAIVADPQLVFRSTSEATAPIAGTYFLTSNSIRIEPFHLGYPVETGYRLQINSDGSGTLRGSFDSTEFQWSMGTDGIEISTASLLKKPYLIWDTTLGTQIQEQMITQLKAIRWLARGQASDILQLELDVTLHYPNGERPDSAVETFQVASTAIKSSGTVSAAKVLTTGAAYSMPLPVHEGEVVSPEFELDPYLDIRATQMVFNGTIEEGGNVSITVESISGQGEPLSTEIDSGWRIDDRGHLLIDNYNSGTVEYVFLNHTDGSAPQVYVALDQGGLLGTSLGNVFREEAPTWTAADVVGIYSYAMDYFYPLNSYWFEVYEDGTALTIFADDFNDDGVLDKSAEIIKQPGLWQINSAGNLVIRRYLIPEASSRCVPSSWDPADEDPCQLYHEREWKLQITNESSVWMRHYHRYFADFYRETLTNVSSDGHLLDLGIIANIELEKLETAPVESQDP